MSGDLPELVAITAQASSEAKALALSIGLGEVPREVVGAWTDRLYIRRQERWAQRLHDAAVRLHAAGIPPQAVRDRLLRDVMELGSLEEAPELNEMWTNLLTSAIAGEAAPPVYAAILSQLEVVEARLLVAASANQRARLPGAQATLADLPSFQGMLEWRHLDNLERLAVVNYRYHGQIDVPRPPEPYTREPLEVALSVSPLGEAFLQACQALE